jgi:hypothetical protein
MYFSADIFHLISENCNPINSKLSEYFTSFLGSHESTVFFISESMLCVKSDDSKENFILKMKGYEDFSHIVHFLNYEIVNFELTFYFDGKRKYDLELNPYIFTHVIPKIKWNPTESLNNFHRYLSRTIQEEIDR